jgi:hypothetical protein
VTVRADSAALERDLKSFPDTLRTTLRDELEGVTPDVMIQANRDANARTAHPSGRMTASLRGNVRTSPSRVTMTVVFAQAGAPYAAWINYGLPGRPWHERSVSRKGWVSSRIGRAKVHKPWGLRALGFAEATRSVSDHLVQGAADKAVARATLEFNGGV